MHLAGAQKLGAPLCNQNQIRNILINVVSTSRIRNMYNSTLSYKDKQYRIAREIQLGMIQNIVHGDGGLSP